jgi:peptidoglycan hydrolase-like protein with peptidoglycan-binding domain
MNRITWSGTALHAGVVPGYPASHGCIRLPFSFAPKLFQITTKGDNVVVARDRLAPQPIEHPALFQPLPPPPAPEMVKQEQPPQRQSSITLTPAPDGSHPGRIAKAEVAGITTDIPSSLEAEAAGQGGDVAKGTQKLPDRLTAESLTPESAAVEDTHVHAFDPFAASARAATTHALDEEEDQAVSTTAEAKPAPKPTPAKVEAAVTAPLTNPLANAAPEASTAAPAPEASQAPAPAEAKPTEIAEAPAPAPSPAPSLVVVPVAATAPLPAPAQALANASAQAVPAPAAAPDFVPSVVTAKLDAGAKAAAIQAAEPRSTAPLRILVTRRTQRDRIIGMQQILAEKGYLPPVDFDGTLGKATANAIKAFQKDNGLPETGAFNDELVQKVYAVAGKGEPPAGHLFVRQEFGRVFDVPVNLRDPETPLGTHLFTALKFNPGDTTARWVAISLQGDDAASALDRIEIPSDIRQKISERLTPGSSLIIGDTAINTATLPKGADFLVWAKDTPAKITTVSADGDLSPAPRKKKKYRSVRRYNNGFSYSVPRTFTRGYPSWPF